MTKMQIRAGGIDSWQTLSFLSCMTAPKDLGSGKT